ncbi:HNH endonuclease signature motif containing protein [Stenotrophomonas sp. ZAC14A_NAIMI4_1]|uniref:HNH endonuclease n=1 Tax=Stenotrophomonas sp. ZAC14A_NAIMI4_1 TaxID=2072412 RepID=UPI00131F34BE|nr:HNH endonuclease signature motif containing protein [Stenotrophomonas sp. ZAC14A_NAIMI4_1]
MILLERPGVSQEVVHLACVSGINDAPTKVRCTQIADLMKLGEREYLQMADARELYRAQPHPRGGDGNLVLLDATRADLKSLYSKQMVPASKSARIHYDSIKMSAKGNICPYCGVGSVETIDHFLPKGRYSCYSILPINLVPSCRDCNTTKADDVCTMEKASSHPYFEDSAVMTEQWLRAEIVETDEILAIYSASPPADWPEERAKRVTNHFNALDLARRYGIQAATRLTVYAELISDVRGNVGETAMISVLNFYAKGEVKAGGVNSWQAALAKAIIGSEYFIREGYRRFTDRHQRAR